MPFFLKTGTSFCRCTRNSGSSEVNRRNFERRESMSFRRSWRRCCLNLGVVTAAVVVAALCPSVAFAQGGVDDPNGVFQLEGNATKDGSVCFPSLAIPSPGCPSGDTLVTFAASTDDWANLNINPYSGHALARTGLITDPTGHGDSILSGGGTK